MARGHVNYDRIRPRYSFVRTDSESDGSSEGVDVDYAEPIFRFPQKSRLYYGYQWWLLKWALPLFLAASGFLMQNFQLHIGTYYYVHEMMQLNFTVNLNETSHMVANRIPLTIGQVSNHVFSGSLHDTGSRWLGPYKAVDIHVLDFVAVLIPLVFVLVTVGTDDLFVWTRVMIVFFVLAVGKGFLSWITVVPDSSGWQGCRDRLAHNAHTVDWYASKHSLLDLLLMDPRERVCADMMWSGHTYFVTLFGLGLHESTRISLRRTEAWKRILCEAVVASFAIAQQTVEIYFVIRSRFHYSSDVVLAILVTYLLFTNNTIAFVTAKWSAPSRQYLNKHPKRSELHSFVAPTAVSLGCCCCTWSQQYIWDQDSMLELMDAVRYSDIDVNDMNDIRDFNMMLSERSILPCGCGCSGEADDTPA